MQSSIFTQLSRSFSAYHCLESQILQIKYNIVSEIVNQGKVIIKYIKMHENYLNGNH